MNPFWFFFVFRALLAVLLVVTWKPLAVLYAVAECQGLWYGLRNHLQASSQSSGWLAWYVAAGYVAAGSLRPSGEPMVVAQVVAGMVCLLAMWVRYKLGSCYTFAEPTYLRIVETGPYAIVRHPLAAMNMLSRVALLACWPTWQNAVFVAAAAVVAGDVIRSEEKFLRRCTADYAEYCRRVRYRLLPLVW